MLFLVDTQVWVEHPVFFNCLLHLPACTFCTCISLSRRNHHLIQCALDWSARESIIAKQGSIYTFKECTLLHSD